MNNISIQADGNAWQYQDDGGCWHQGFVSCELARLDALHRRLFDLQNRAPDPENQDTILAYHRLMREVWTHRLPPAWASKWDTFRKSYGFRGHATVPVPWRAPKAAEQWARGCGMDPAVLAEAVARHHRRPRKSRSGPPLASGGRER